MEVKIITSSNKLYKKANCKMKTKKRNHMKSFILSYFSHYPPTFWMQDENYCLFGYRYLTVENVTII